MKYHFFEEREFTSKCPHAWDIICYARSQTNVKDILFESAVLSTDMTSCTAKFSYYASGSKPLEITVDCIFHQNRKCEFSHSTKQLNG